MKDVIARRPLVGRRGNLTEVFAQDFHGIPPSRKLPRKDRLWVNDSTPPRNTAGECFFSRA